MMDAKLVNQFLAGVAGAEMLPHQERLAVAAMQSRARRRERNAQPPRFTLPPAYEAMRRGRSI
ncbi:MAG: hypothetical protein GX856_03275 [Gammaproteobacteria bacterium]|jgi:hypothetical protein|nr:hypothetical protein [Gammaproteobacteria bacterium]